MPYLRVLHVMNTFADSSISRIVERIIRLGGNDRFEWHVSALDDQGTMQSVYRDLGAAAVHLPDWRAIRAYAGEHDFAIVHTHTPRTIVAAWRAIGTLTPRPRHVATKHLLTAVSDRQWGLYFALADRLSLYLPDQLVPVSETMAQQIKNQPWMHARRVYAIPNAIPCDLYDLPQERDACRQELGFAAGDWVMGYAGRMDPVKQLDLLLQAFSRLLPVYPPMRLLLVGEGSMQAEWQALSRRLGVDHAVCWAGFRQDIPRLLAAMDAYVQPSGNEGLSLSILEAMSAGKSIVSTTVGAAHEILTDGETALLVSPGNVDELEGALARLAQDPDLSRRLARNAQHHVNSAFGLPRMVESYLDLYTTLANRRGGL